MTSSHRASTPGTASPGVDAYYDAWRCEFCGTYKAVPQLARDCEQRHVDELDEAQPESA